MMWAVTLTFDIEPLSPEDAGRLEVELASHDGFVANIPGQGVDVTVYESGDLMKAADHAMALLSTVLSAEPSAIEVESEARRAIRADAPTLPELVSAPEVAEILGGISRQRVHQLRDLAAFPKPVLDLRTGPIWDAAAVRKFEREWTRKPGRPAVDVRETSVHGTKAEAQAKGRSMATDRRVKLVVRNKDGRIGARNTFGNDPRSPKS
jgi:hypothetical protein